MMTPTTNSETHNKRIRIAEIVIRILHLALFTMLFISHYAQDRKDRR